MQQRFTYPLDVLRVMSYNLSRIVRKTRIARWFRIGLKKNNLKHLFDLYQTSVLLEKKKIPKHGSFNYIFSTTGFETSQVDISISTWRRCGRFTSSLRMWGTNSGMRLTRSRTWCKLSFRGFHTLPKNTST